MTNQPGLIADSLIEFGQTGSYHTHSMTEAKEAAGFAPLETLPAEWYNNYIYKLDAHINELQTLLRQVQQELTNIITWDSTVTPSGIVLNQVYAAIQRKIQAMLPVIATGSTAGLVVSDSGVKTISVAADGVMSVNALSDWNTSDTIKVFVEGAIASALDGAEGDIGAEVTARKAKDVNSITLSKSGDTLNVTATSTDGTTHTGTAVNPINTATLSKSGNTLNVSVNGVTGTAVSPISTATLSKSGDTLNVSVNGVTGTAVNPINTATLSKSGNNLNVSVNGVTGTAVNPINTATLFVSGNNLNVSVNGVSGAVDTSANYWYKAMTAYQLRAQDAPTQTFIAPSNYYGSSSLSCLFTGQTWERLIGPYKTVLSSLASLPISAQLFYPATGSVIAGGLGAGEVSLHLNLMGFRILSGTDYRFYGDGWLYDGSSTLHEVRILTFNPSSTALNLTPKYAKNAYTPDLASTSNAISDGTIDICMRLTNA